MTDGERIAYIAYRIEKADETLKVAQFNADNGFWNTCANRLYYAAFYALNALSLLHGHQTQTHKGVKILFAQHFIKTKHIDLIYNDLYTELFDKRQAGDYADLLDWTEDDILPLIQPTKEFIETIKNLMKSK